MELNFTGGDELIIVSAFDALAKKYNRNLEKVRGSVNYDPLGFYSLHGRFQNSEEEDFSKLIKLYKDEQGIHKTNLGGCRFVKLVGEYGWKG